MTHSVLPLSPLAALGLALLTSASSALQTRGQSAEAAVTAALAGIDDPHEIARGREELARLGSAAIEPLFARLCSEGGSSEPAALMRRATVLAALAALPPEDVLAHLGRVARASRDERERVSALDLLGRLGGRGELKLALELGTPGGEDLPGPALRAALENALCGILARDAGAARILAGYFPHALPAAQAALVASLSAAGGDEAVALLAAQLGSAGGEVDALLLLELGRIAGRGAPSEDVLVLDRVRDYLTCPDRRLAVLACTAVEKLRDHEAVPDLIALLADSDENLHARAHAALIGLTGLAFECEPQAWMAWLSEALSWWEERAEPCRVALVSGTSAEAAGAVQEIAGQRLFVHQAARMLELALTRPERDVVKSACRALSATREPSAVAALAELSDPTVADHARAALEARRRVRRPAESSSIRPLTRSRNP